MFIAFHKLKNKNSVGTETHFPLYSKQQQKKTTKKRFIYHNLSNEDTAACEIFLWC